MSADYTTGPFAPLCDPVFGWDSFVLATLDTVGIVIHCVPVGSSPFGLMAIVSVGLGGLILSH